MEDEHLYSLLLVDEQVLVADEDNVDCMFEKWVEVDTNRVS